MKKVGKRDKMTGGCLDGQIDQSRMAQKEQVYSFAGLFSKATIISRISGPHNCFALQTTAVYSGFHSPSQLSLNEAYLHRN
jgi:hypothetical protein